MNPEEIKKIAASTVRIALDEGAETVEVSVLSDNQFGVTIRNDNIENLTESGSNAIGITISRDKRKSSATSSDLSESSIRRLIHEAVELSSVMDRDEYFGLPDKDELGSTSEDLGLFDFESAEISTEKKISIARDLERIALKSDSRIISDGASFSSGLFASAYANSLGFCEGYRQTHNSIDISCAVEDFQDGGENTGKKQSSYWFSTSTSFRDLDPVESVASTAVERTLRKLGAVKPDTCEVPVIFDEVTARGFLGSIASAVNGGNIYKRTSFLADMTGMQISSPLVTIIDDPLIPGNPGSRPYDSEGVRSKKTTVVENGILRSFLLSSYQARKLSLKTTGNAGGISNFFMKKGSSSIDDIISSIDNGLFLTSLSGPGANISSGDFSQGGQGIWIIDGKLAFPVSEFTIAGTFSQMLSGIVMVADTLDWRTSIASPAFKIEGMTISGK
ncbi:MAG: TldD/PmbA family protein [Candidatus Krumholzibacteriota bacterium]|nr:TldD/PmbA family protein [Candidatus Krumholzibacteriota bacterium]